MSPHKSRPAVWASPSDTRNAAQSPMPPRTPSSHARTGTSSIRPLAGRVELRTSPMHERLRHELRTQQIEAHMRPLVRPGSVFVGWHRRTGRWCRGRPRPRPACTPLRVFPRRPEAADGFRPREASVHVVVGWVRQRGHAGSDTKDDPRRFAPWKRLKVVPCRMSECSESVCVGVAVHITRRLRRIFRWRRRLCLR
jgi:hypothetical protein